jgi:hypothetical protein
MLSEAQKQKITTSLTNSVPLTITTHKVSRETELRIEAILEFVLLEFGLGEITDKISYCLKEIVTNAKKANTKRVYFEVKGLDMNDEKDYPKGMETFKQETLDNLEYYLKIQEESGLYVKITFIYRGNSLVISVRNNSEIKENELIKGL